MSCGADELPEHVLGGVVHWRCNSAWWLAWCSWSPLEQVVTSKDMRTLRSHQKLPEKLLFLGGSWMILDTWLRFRWRMIHLWVEQPSLSNRIVASNVVNPARGLTNRKWHLTLGIKAANLQGWKILRFYWKIIWILCKWGSFPRLEDNPEWPLTNLGLVNRLSRPCSWDCINRLQIMGIMTANMSITWT